MLINKAKEKDRSQQRFLALSQKVMSEGKREENDQVSNLPNETYQNRPFTSAYGQKALTSDNSNGRMMSRKQKFRGKVNSHKNFGKFNMVPKPQSKSSKRVTSIRRRKFSSNRQGYQENDVRGLRIVDYFSGMNRLNRYAKKSKERFRKAHKHGYNLKPQHLKHPLITSYK